MSEQHDDPTGPPATGPGGDTPEHPLPPVAAEDRTFVGSPSGEVMSEPATDVTSPTPFVTPPNPAATTPPPPPAGAGGWRRFLAGAAIGALVGGGVGGAVAVVATDDAPKSTPVTAKPATLPTLQGSTDVRSIVESAAPAIVSIQTRGLSIDGFLQPMAQEGAGSGFIVGSDGLIVTNHHVIDGARNITISLADGRELTGTVLGTDPTRDLAVVKVDATDLPTLTLGRSDDLVVGDQVIAIGNALALGHSPTVTSGIVSALDRTISVGDGSTLRHLLQTDAAINPGNSGGPLLNSRGEVVGINTAVAGDAQNIGFAIAIDSVRDDVTGLRDGTVPRRPFLGVQTVTVDASIAERLQLNVDEGALIVDITPGSAAELGGLQRGDVVTKVGDTKIDSAEALSDAIDTAGPGAKVDVEINRSGKSLTRTVTIGERAGSLAG